MNRTQEYYRIAQAHREALRAIWTAYNDTLTRIDRYKGSAGYEEDKREAEKARDAAIKAQAQVTAAAFDSVLSGMRERAGGVVAIPPTAEELRLLEALKLREVDTGKPGVKGLTREELTAAGRALQDNTIALHTLDSIAGKHGYYNMFINYPAWSNTASAHQQRIAALTASAREIVRLTRPDGGAEAISAAVRSGEGALSAIRNGRIDRDFPDAEAAVTYLGSMTAAEYPGFAAAVND